MGELDELDQLTYTGMYDDSKRAFDYSPWKWQHAVAIIVFVAWLTAGRYLYDYYQRLLRRGKTVQHEGAEVPYSLDVELVKRDNKASAIDFASFILAIGMITYGSLSDVSPEDSGRYFYTYFAYQGLGVVGIVAARALNDAVVLRSVVNVNSIVDDRNVAAALVEAGATIASALIVLASASGYDPDRDFGEGIAACVLYWVIGQVVLIIFILTLDYVTKVPLWRGLSVQKAKAAASPASPSGLQMAEAGSAGSEEVPRRSSRFTLTEQAGVNNVAAGMQICLEFIAIGIIVQAASPSSATPRP